MKKIFRNRMFIGVISILIGLFVTFIIAPAVIKNKEEKTTVIRVKKDIEQSAKIDSSMLEPLEVYSKNVPPNMIKYKDVDKVIGSYAMVDIFENDNILTNKLSKEPLTKYKYLTDIDNNQLALSISIDSLEKAVSDKLEQGDIVSVFASNVGVNSETVLPDTLKYVEVLAVTLENGQDINEGTKEDDETTATVTFNVNEKQALELVELNENAKIHLALVYRGDKEIANKFLDAQNKMFSGGNDE